MLEVYRWEPNAASARVLIALKELGLEFRSHFVDLDALEQLSTAFLGLNDRGQVPILVDGGKVFSEVSYICEYLSEVYGDGALTPETALGRWRMREWQKHVDDYLAGAVADLCWETLGPLARGVSRSEIEKAVAATASLERKAAWTEALKGIGEDRRAKAEARLDAAIRLTEKDLEKGPYLLGARFTLADIAVFAYLNYAPRLAPDALGGLPALRTRAWLARMAERPGVKAALALGRASDPFALASLGPEAIRWG